MNRRSTFHVAFTAAAFLMAGMAAAQSSPPASSPSAAPAGTSATTAPSSPPSTTTPNAMSSPAGNQLSLPTKTDSASSAFSKLSTKHAGYVTSEDVAKLQGFDFNSADKNHDGKLDQSEFNAAWTAYSGGQK